MKSRHPKIILGDKLPLGKYATVADRMLEHFGRVVTPQKQLHTRNCHKLILLTRGTTSVGDSFCDSWAIKVNPISKRLALKLIKRSDEELQEINKRKEWFSEC